MPGNRGNVELASAKTSKALETSPLSSLPSASALQRRNPMEDAGHNAIATNRVEAKHVSHLFAGFLKHGPTEGASRAMQPHLHCAFTQVQNAGYFFCVNLFHITKHQH